MLTLLANSGVGVAQPRSGEPDTEIATVEDEAEIALRMGLSLRLRQTRKLIDKNRTRIAAKFGVHHTVWQKWEEGRTLPAPWVMVSFCDSYDITLDWLYRGKMRGLPDYLISLLYHAHPEYAEVGAVPPPREGEGEPDPQSPPATGKARPAGRYRRIPDPPPFTPLGPTRRRRGRTGAE